MPPEALKLLVDIRQALEDIRDFTSGIDAHTAPLQFFPPAQLFTALLSS